VTSAPTEGIWTKLRSRKVVQWGIAYIALAWGLLQGIGFVADAFAWPAAAKQIATLVLVIGLPFVLVLAWYHGDRGQQRVTGTELGILALLFVLGGGFLWRYQPPKEARTPQVTALAGSQSREALPPDDKSIAVLPFADMSAEKDQEYMSDGIAEELLNRLAQVPDLKVDRPHILLRLQRREGRNRRDRTKTERRPRAGGQRTQVWRQVACYRAADPRGR
jgi:hypothetical protein